MNDDLHADIPPMKVIDIKDVLQPGEAPAALKLHTKNGVIRPVPDEDVYPALFDTELMNKCYVIVMKGGSFEDCRTTYDVDIRTVAKWAQSGSWLKIREEVERTAAEEERQKLDMVRREERIPELRKQIDVGKMLRERVSELLDDDTREFKPGELKMLGDALKSAGDNTVRAMGVSETGSTARDEDGKDKGSKAPLVVLIQGGGLPPVRISEPIDV